ncbi:MAG: RimK family protein [Gammaproteobacteria bacterium]|nr:RimK family protein [Gammaproteobacteria bacterium]
MHSIVVTNKPKDWDFQIPDVEVISAKAYLTDQKYSEMRNVRVYNLCQSYRYQGMGYYVSLLAEARGHRSFPNITTMQDLKSLSIVRIISDELDKIIQSNLARLRSSTFELNIYFGQSVTKLHKTLSRQLYNLFPAPLLHVTFLWNKDQNKWLIQSILPLPLNQVPLAHLPPLFEFSRQYFVRKRIRSKSHSKLIYDLAILTNADEKSPPSDKKALDKFLEAAEDVGLRARIISKNDYSRIPEFDALFIRETTAVNHHTYRFARRATAENLIVIDDPISIVKCANKVYMAERLKNANIATPKTMIVHKKNKDELIKVLGFPCVLKQPDGSFSTGVSKVTDAESLDKELNRLLNQSDLIIAQEFVPTEYDWRIGILNKKPLYACKYYMAKNHWQIAHWHGNERRDGEVETVPIDQVPEKILKNAIRAASLIGDGLYGVDLKYTTAQQTVVIEINDNPSIEYSYEDSLLKDDLYAQIMSCMFQRIKRKKDGIVN